MAGHGARCHLCLVSVAILRRQDVVGPANERHTLQEETAKVESHLLEAQFTDAIVSCFNTAKINAFDSNLLEPLLKVLRLSPSVSASLAKPEMYTGIAQKLGHKKAVVRLNLLRLVRNILDTGETDRGGLSPSSGRTELRDLLDQIQSLADEDSAVLVRNLASELARSHIHTGTDVVPLSGGGPPSTSSSRSRSGPRRTSSYTPPDLRSSASAPPLTPTHGHRPTQSSAFIEVASTPKRTAVALTHERDAAIHRPRSRDGAGSSLPRRVSGEAGATTNGATAPKSRLPRHPTTLGRPSLGPAIVNRSESSMSNKENVGRYSVSGAPPPAAAAAAADNRIERVERAPAPGAKRRSRAPSTDVKWS